MSPPLIVALTPRGHELGLRLARALGRGDVVLAAGQVRETLQDAFASGRPLVCVMALGIVVRALAPLVRDKHSDPAVLTVDEAGRFVIPVLGGHAAGANALAHELARAVGATAVITTASDALGLPAVDLIGRDRGWIIEATEDLTAVAAAVVRGEPVGVWQDAGRRDWCAPFGPWPASFTRLDRWPPAGRWAGLLVISDRAGPFAGFGPVLVYRPPSLVLGVGCKRGVPCDEIEAMFQEVCRGEGVSPLSLGRVATASLKADEPGLVEFAAGRGVPLCSYAAEELASVGPLPTPSEVVRARVGVAGVAEPAAMLAANTRTLLMPKRRGRRVTMALARREEA
jgi:cobalamin biosynthesis protein CbiG